MNQYLNLDAMKAGLDDAVKNYSVILPVVLINVAGEYASRSINLSGPQQMIATSFMRTFFESWKNYTIIVQHVDNLFGGKA